MTDDWRSGLTGNLCRCTGYVPIVDAGLRIDADAVEPLNEIYPPAPMLQRSRRCATESVAVNADGTGRMRAVLQPDLACRSARDSPRSSRCKDRGRRDRRRRATQQGRH